MMEDQKKRAKRIKRGAKSYYYSVDKNKIIEYMTDMTRRGGGGVVSK